MAVHVEEVKTEADMLALLLRLHKAYVVVADECMGCCRKAVNGADQH